MNAVLERALRRVAASRRSLKFAGLAALFACAGCTPLYLPPVPEGRSSMPAPRLELDEGSRLSQTSLGSLELRLAFRTVPEAGWLALQWFTPDGDERASDAIWLEPNVGPNETANATANEAIAAVFALPGEAEPEPGLWRAVLSFEGRLIRQFTLEVP